MITAFSEPYSVSIKHDAGIGAKGMMIALKGDLVLLILETGELSWCNIGWLTVDWRYEVERDRWVDVGVPEEVTGQEDV